MIENKGSLGSPNLCGRWLTLDLLGGDPAFTGIFDIAKPSMPGSARAPIIATSHDQRLEF